MKVETVKIKCEKSNSGFKIINKSDLQASNSVYGQKAAPAKPEAKPTKKVKISGIDKKVVTNFKVPK